jgi:hypothetical protein
MERVTEPLVGLTWRNQVAAAALLIRGRFLVRRIKLGSHTGERMTRLAAFVARLCADYQVGHVVLEPHEGLESALLALALQPVVVTLAEAKEQLVPELPRVSHLALFEALLLRYPTLRRHVRTLPSGACASSAYERRRTVTLLSVALALAAFASAATNQQQL